MASDVLTIEVKVKVRGLWRITLLGWAIRLFRLGPQHVVVDQVVGDPE